MDRYSAFLDDAGMGKKPATRFRTLYVGQWISALGRKPGEVSKASGVDEGYLSQIISGVKDNPSAATLMALAEELSLTVNHFYRKPPENNVTERIKRIRPDQLEALESLLADFKKPDDRK